MRRMLLVTALLAALAIGCVDHRAHPASVPTGGATEASTPPDRGSPTSTPSATARALTNADLCLANAAHCKLTLTPSAPQGGESVRVSGGGLVPGSYFALLGIPQTDALTYSARPVAVVGSDGLLDIQLTLPTAIVANRRHQLVLYQAPSGNRLGARINSVSAAPFIMSGNVLTPAACERLPEDIWLSWGGSTATISPPPYRPNSPITVTGTGLTDASEIRARFQVTHNPTPEGVVTTLGGSGTHDAAGNFSYTFIPRPDPALTGLCVTVVVSGLPLTGDGPYAIARFTYP